MFFELGLKLLLGLIGIEEEFLFCPEGQAAYVTIRQARGFPDEPCNLKISVSHYHHDYRAFVPRQIICVGRLGPAGQ